MTGNINRIKYVNLKGVILHWPSIYPFCHVLFSLDYSQAKRLYFDVLSQFIMIINILDKTM